MLIFSDRPLRTGCGTCDSPPIGDPGRDPARAEIAALREQLAAVEARIADLLRRVAAHTAPRRPIHAHVRRLTDDAALARVYGMDARQVAALTLATRRCLLDRIREEETPCRPED